MNMQVNEEIIEMFRECILDRMTEFEVAEEKFSGAEEIGRILLEKLSDIEPLFIYDEAYSLDSLREHD